MLMPVYITIIAAAVAGVLSGLGVGSAGLFVLYLTLVLHMEQVAAQGVNLLFFLFSAGASLLLHVRERHIPWGLVVFLVICAIPGSMLGTYWVSVVDGALLRRMFGGMLVVSGCMTLFKKQRDERNINH